MDVLEEPQQIDATIKYMQYLELYEKEKPYQILIDIPEDAGDRRYNNIKFEQKEQTFRNVRGHERSFDLDDHGFTYRSHDFNFDNYEHRQSVERVYLPKVERFLKAEVEGIDKVFFFDWRVRRL